MKIADLINIVDTFNANTFPGILPKSQVSLVASMNSKVVISSGMLPIRHCFCGQTGKGYTSSKCFVDKCLTLDDPRNPASKCSVAVGAVIDNQIVAPETRLPVILAVGINYGQQSKHFDYVNQNVPLVASTGMRYRLQRIFHRLRKKQCPAKAEALDNDFHLVAANFFPWITSEAWSDYDFNSLEQSALIHCCGHACPEEYIVDLASRIPLHTLIFHGANNAVQFFGGSVVRKCFEKQDGAEVDVIFSDNIDDSKRKRVWNAIKLCNCKQRTQALCAEPSKALLIR